MEMATGELDVYPLYYYNNANLGRHYLQVHDYFTAVKYFLESKEFYTKNIDKEGYKLKLVSVLDNLAACYDMTGKHDLAVVNQADCYNFCLELFEQRLITR